MKRFVFRLARLERVRALYERQARAALAQAAGEWNTRRSHSAAAHAAVDDAAATRLPAELAADAGAMQQLAAWRAEQARALERARKHEAEAAQAAQAAMERHTQVARDHKVIERLRHKRHRRWLQEVESEERRFLDETHLARLVRESGRHPGRDKE